MKTLPRQLAILFLFIAAVVFTTYLCVRIISLMPWRPIQVLTDTSYRHTATLSRLDGIDVIFRINLDGEEIYSSPDFAPRRSLAFREYMTWDDTGTVLIFCVADKILFAYDTATQKPLPADHFPTLKLQHPTLQDLGYEGIPPK